MTGALPGGRVGAGVGGGVGVVSIAHGRHDHLAMQHRSLAANVRRPDVYVTVAMGDRAIATETWAGLRRDVVHLPAERDGLPLAAARNLGVRAAARAGAEVVVLLDVDCLAGPDLVSGYAEACSARPDVLWSGPVTYLPPPPPTGYDLERLPQADAPHPARPAPAPGEVLLRDDPDLFWSLSFATTVPTWRRIGGFHEGYSGYGGEDTDFGRSAVTAGVPMGWTGSARAYHQHHPVSDPPLEHLDDLLRNGALFHERWGTWPMQGWFEAFERAGRVRREGAGWVARDR